MQDSSGRTEVLRYRSAHHREEDGRQERDLSIVVSAMDDHDDIDDLLRRLTNALGPLPRAEIILVGGMTAQLPVAVDEAMRNHDLDHDLDIVLVRRSDHWGGRGGAVIEGLRLAAAPWAVVMDAHLHHAPPLVPALLAAVADDVDLVVATPSAGQAGWRGGHELYRRAASSSAAKLARLVLGSPIAELSDPFSGLFAVRTAALRLHEVPLLGYKVLLEFIVQFDLDRIAEVPYRRTHGPTTPAAFTPTAAVRYVRNLLALRSAVCQERQGSCKARSRPDSSRPVSCAHPEKRRNDHAHGDVWPGRRLNVLVITSEAPPIVSGISRCVDRVTAGLEARGHNVDVISSVQVPRISMREWRLSSMLVFMPALARRLSDYDVVNVHGPVPSMSDVLLTLTPVLRPRTPIVYTHHSAIQIRGVERLCRLYNRFHRRIAMRATMTMTTSEHYRNLMQVPGGPPVRLVPWGVDLRAAPVRKEHDDQPLRVLFVGQMRSYKGVDCLLEALVGQPRLELTLVGSGPHLTEYQRLARRLGGTNVRFLGRVADERLHFEYDHSDVIALPSVTEAEAFGLVVLEGMASGCVPVVSDLPGVRDLVMGNGVVVPPRDADALRAAVVALADDRGRLRSLRARARQRAEQMSWDACVSRYEEAFYDVAAGCGVERRAAPAPRPGRTGQRSAPRIPEQVAPRLAKDAPVAQPSGESGRVHLGWAVVTSSPEGRE